MSRPPRDDEPPREVEPDVPGPEPEPKPHFSHSQLAMIARCGLQYDFRYVQGIRNPPGIALIRGTATHGAIHADLQNVVDHGELLPDEQIPDLASMVFEQRLEREGLALSDVEVEQGEAAVVGAAKDMSIALAVHHHAEDAPELRPLHVERPFRVAIQDSPRDLLGYIDVQEVDGSIEDTKTSGRTPPKGTADLSDQLTIYALAGLALDGFAPPQLRLRTLVQTKKGGPKTNLQITSRDGVDFERVLRRVELATAIVEAGTFYPAPRDSWACSERWCGYWSRCPFGARQRRAVAVPANVNVSPAAPKEK